jgi:hypothetical protein
VVDELVAAGAAGCDEFVLVEFDELLPQAASARDAATANGVILSALRMLSSDLGGGTRGYAHVVYD